MNIVKTHLGILFAVVVLGWWFDGVETQGALTPVSLHCSGRVNPLGIEDISPRLSWQLQTAGQRGETQSAYQIQVGSTAGTAGLWDSGKVASSQTVDIVYAGQPLTSGKKCLWQVRVYDGSNNVSAWSPTAYWSMGLLTNWAAQWIGYDAAYAVTPQQAISNAMFNTVGVSWVFCPNQVAPYQSSLRRNLVIPAGQTVTNAVFVLYADNTCGVFVNGVQTSTIATRWEATAKINITSLLRTGTNVVALSNTNSDAQVWAMATGRLIVQFASGSVTNIPLDASWKAAQWPAAGWTQTNYDDSAWTAAGVTGIPWGTPQLNDIPRVPAPYLRKSFSVSKTVTRATVYVTALGVYEFHLNGQKVGSDVLTPGWTEYRKRVYYQTYDVTGMVQGGSNTISAILGDGWYGGVVGMAGARRNYGGTPRFLAQLVIEFPDGSTQTVVSDASWKASYGPILFADLLMGSSYDARLEMPGWDTTNFNDSAWSSVVTGQNTSPIRCFDVTSIIAGLVTNNQVSFYVNNTTFGGDPAYLILKSCQMNYTLGGTNQTVVFSENALVQIGGNGLPLTINQAYYGDASIIAGAEKFQVQAAVTEPSRCLETMAATTLTLPKPGCYTFDLGQNMVGWVRLRATGSAGDRITVRHGEMLNPDGTIYVANVRGANSTDFYILGTNGTTTFEPFFTFHGFRYVEVRGLTVPPTLSSVTGIVVHSDMPQAGTFACSSPLVNRLFSNVVWGQKGNYLEVPTDCPQRDERLGYTGDAQFFVPTAAYNFDIQTFMRRHIMTMCEDSLITNGAYPMTAPDFNQQTSGTAWGDAGWICPYNMYRSYGDTNIINDHYASMQRFGQYVAPYVHSFVITNRPDDLGDWLNLGSAATFTVIDTAYYAYYAQAMSEMAAVIGRTADAASYATLHSNVAAAFGTFFNPDGSFTDGSGQTGYALAFSLNLVPATVRANAVQQFANSISQYGNHLATGFIGTPRLLGALHAAGCDDLAYTLLLQQTYPSWLYQVNLGATTMWERWDGWTPTGGFQSVGMNSFNHYAFGSVGAYLYSGIGGINTDSPSYKTMLIQPVPGNGLTWASTSYNSIRGLVSTAWTNTGSAFNLDVVVPPNTTANIYVPTTNAAAITESGVLASSAPGVSYVGFSNNYGVFAVGSGHYTWSSPYQIQARPSVTITTTNQTGSGSGGFTPSWSVVTNGSLIAGKVPDSATGNFNLEPYWGNRSVNSLTAGGSLTITRLSNTTSTNYVTCGNNYGAGSSVVYSLTGSSTGYDVTNIVVYGGWGDYGRDQQAYCVYCSTVSAPSNFISLASVNYNPAIAANLQSATRVTLASSVGALAKNVAALKFDFSSPASENGYCGYAAIAVFGRVSSSLAPAALSAALLDGLTNFVMNVGSLSVGQSYTLESTTNLAAAWSAETNFIATNEVVTLTSSVSAWPQKFFRIVTQ